MIKICVFVSKTPCKIKIYSLDGKLYQQAIINQNWAEFCICNTAKTIAVLAEWESQTQTAYFKPAKMCHQCVYFNFKFSQQSSTLQRFVLLDKNYNFPVRSAILNFK